MDTCASCQQTTDDRGFEDPLDPDGNCADCASDAATCEGCGEHRKTSLVTIRNRTYALCLACEQDGES